MVPALTRIPKHIAIIMDGNGRWARHRNRLRSFGHQHALKAVRSTIEAAAENGVKYLTLFAFSSENWNRPKPEVSALMRLFRSAIADYLDDIHRENIKIKVIGNISNFATDIQKLLAQAIEKTKNNTKMTLTLALSYGSREEIKRAVISISQAVKDRLINPEDIDEAVIKKHLYTHDLPDVDLLIRTGKEQRISNFLLLQAAYAELYFCNVLWPDFSKQDLLDAMLEFQARQRRFGKTSEQILKEHADV